LIPTNERERLTGKEIQSVCFDLLDVGREMRQQHKLQIMQHCAVKGVHRKKKGNTISVLVDPLDVGREMRLSSTNAMKGVHKKKKGNTISVCVDLLDECREMSLSSTNAVERSTQEKERKYNLCVC
jgi:hypothetical protein